MTTESGRIFTRISQREPYQQIGQFPCSVKSVCPSVCVLPLSLSVRMSSSFYSVCAGQGRNERACVLVPQVRTLARPAGRCCRMKGQDQGQDQDQDRTGSYLQEAVSPYRQLGAKHGPPTPGPPRIALEVPQRQSAVPQQPDTHGAQTSPGSPATIAFPFHQSTLNISPPRPARPNPTGPSCGNPSLHVLA